MSRLMFMLITVVIGLAIILFPIVLIVNPVYQQHILLEKKKKILAEIVVISAKLPNAFKKNREKIAMLREKLQKSVSGQSIEEMVQQHHLQIELIKPHEGGEKNEVHLMLKGNYRDLLAFLETLSRSANAMELIYVSMNKNRINIIFKNDEV